MRPAAAVVSNTAVRSMACTASAAEAGSAQQARQCRSSSPELEPVAVDTDTAAIVAVPLYMYVYANTPLLHYVANDTNKRFI